MRCTGFDADTLQVNFDMTNLGIMNLPNNQKIWRPPNFLVCYKPRYNELPAGCEIVCNTFQVFRCVGTSCVHARSPQIITVPDKDRFLLRTMCWVKCWRYRCSYCIRINCRQIIRALCGHCRAISGNSTPTYSCAMCDFCMHMNRKQMMP